jgi:hypothetical protein
MKNERMPKGATQELVNNGIIRLKDICNRKVDSEGVYGIPH